MSAIDWEGAELGRADLRDMNFSFLRFAHATLVEARFDHTILDCCTFTHADCSYASFEGADLRNTTFTYAQLMGASFTGARLNLSSHDLLGEVLRQRGGEYPERENPGTWHYTLLSFISMVKEADDLCWEDWRNMFAAGEVPTEIRGFLTWAAEPWPEFARAVRHVLGEARYFSRDDDE